MKIIERDNFKLFVHIGECKTPNDIKTIYFIKEELDKNQDLILRNTYEFYMNKDEMKKLAKVLNDYE